MALSSFNPLTIFNDLRANGMHEPQAEAVVRGIEQSRGDLATNPQLALMQAQIERTTWRAAVAIGALVVAVGGLIIGAIAAFGN